MNSRINIQESRAVLTAELQSLEGQLASADPANVGWCRQLRTRIQDVTADIAELDRQADENRAWEASPSRLQQLEFALQQADLAASEVAEVEKMWLELAKCISQFKRLNQQIKDKHLSIDARVQNVVEARFPRDVEKQTEQIRMIAPFARGSSTNIGHAVAAEVREALLAAPYSTALLNEFLVPNEFTNWKDVSIASAVKASIGDFEIRMRDIMKERP